MINPVRVVQLTFAVGWILVGAVAAWLSRDPWTSVDRSTIMVVFGMVVLFGGIIWWADRPALARVVAIIGAALGLGAVAAYFALATAWAVALFVAMAVTGAILLAVATK